MVRWFVITLGCTGLLTGCPSICRPYTLAEEGPDERVQRIDFEIKRSKSFLCPPDAHIKGYSLYIVFSRPHWILLIDTVLDDRCVKLVEGHGNYIIEWFSQTNRQGRMKVSIDVVPGSVYQFLPNSNEIQIKEKIIEDK